MKSSSSNSRSLPPPLSLRSNFLWTLIGNGIFAASQWGMLVLLTKFTSEERVGRFFLGLAIATPIYLFTNMNLRAVQVADTKERFSYDTYYRLRLNTVVLSFFLIVGVVLGMRYAWETSIIIIFVGVYKGFEAISKVIYGLFQKWERMDKISISTGLKGVLSLLAIALIVGTTQSIFWGTIGLGVTYCASLVLYDLRQSRLFPTTALTTSDASSPIASTLSAKDGSTKALIKHAFPLGFASMFAALGLYIPSYSIEHYLGEAQLGIYSALSYLMVLGTMVMTALGQAASVRMAHACANHDVGGFLKPILGLCALATLLGGMLVATAFFFGEPLLTLLYKASYAKQNHVFVWLMIAATLIYISYGLIYGMLASQSFNAQPWISGVSNLLLLGGCLWLIPRHGMVGAAWSISLTYVFQILLLAGWNIHTIRTLQKARQSG